VGLFACIDVWV